MEAGDATTSSLFHSAQGLLLVSLAMERIIQELVPLLPLAKRQEMQKYMDEVRSTLKELVPELTNIKPEE